ncbi:MAG: chorismate synthase [Christensenellales bacterium]
MSLYKGGLTVEIFGESHSERIGARVANMPETEVDFCKLKEFTDRRKASDGVFSTTRKEKDEPVFEGIVDGKIDGEYSFVIKNENVRSGDYNELYAKPRPSHADYAWFLKDGALDFRGGGRFSGRLTAPLCVVGGICKQYLEKKGVYVEAYVASVGTVCGKSYKDGEISRDELLRARDDGFPSLDKKEEMKAEIASAKMELDSVGGTVECVVYGLEGGYGDNLFGGIEGKIASLCYAVPAVKGVEFGYGFGLAKMKGSEANDPLRFVDGKVKITGNKAGGINGGISNGATVTLRVAFRPTPSIGKIQSTVDLVENKNAEIQIKGRHDSCIVPRAVPCIESAVAIALTEIIGERI